MSTSSPPTLITDSRGRGCTSTRSRPTAASNPTCAGADDRAGPHRDIARLHIVAGAAHVGARAHTPQHLDPRLSPVGPPQRQHRVGQRRHGCTGLDPDGLLGLQAGRRARAGLDGTDHRQTELTVGIVVGIVRTGGTDHVDAAHRVPVDRSLVEARKGPFGHDLLGAHQALRLGDRNAYRSRGHGCRLHAGLLLFHRTHNAPFCLWPGRSAGSPGRRALTARPGPIARPASGAGPGHSHHDPTQSQPQP